MKITLYLNAVCAGFPSPATDYIEGEIDLNRYLIKNIPSTFIVKSQGNCMLQDGIHSGDLLIVDRSVTPKNDNIVIASVFGDLTVKKLRKKGSSLFLVSANNEYPSIEIKEEMECFIWGVVTYVIHRAVTK